ncbi:MAG: hypothetical protein IJ632_04995 [Muribaculaceae bacterium]|nr:hypothetical protein [Muribaculaceae bacterium]
MKLWKHYLVLAAMVLVASGACHAATSGDFAFLRALGVDMNRVAVLTDAPFNGGDDAHGASLTTEQYIPLLNDVYRFKQFSREELEEMEGNFFITGVRALPGGNTLVVVLVELGDCADNDIAVFDRQGHLIDYLDGDTWASMDNTDANEDYTAGTAYNTTGMMQFDSDTEFHITKRLALVDWVNRGEWKREAVATHWTIEKTYHYRVDTAGHLSLQRIDSATDGSAEPRLVQEQDIRMLQFYPRSQDSRLDFMNTKAMDHDVKRLMADPDATAGFLMEQVMYIYYRQNPQQVLNWMASHRGRDNCLLTVFERLFSNSWVRKEELIDEMQRMTDPSARSYMERITGQWGPADAVG